MLTTKFRREAVREAITQYGCPEIFNTDQGCQFISREFIGVLKDHGIQMSRPQPPGTTYELAEPVQTSGATSLLHREQGCLESQNACSGMWRAVANPFTNWLQGLRTVLSSVLPRHHRKYLKAHHWADDTYWALAKAQYP